MKHYIAFESSESCGKTTQVNLLKERYGDKLFFTKEPGSPHIEICKRIRALILDPDLEMSPTAEMNLFAADRYEHTKYLVENVLSHTSVVTDRSIFSSFAYQADENIPMDFIADANRSSMEMCMPNLVFYFELDEETRLQRLKDRGQSLDRIEKKDKSYFDKIADNFKEAFWRYADEVIVIDASKSIEEIHELIVNELKARDII